MDQCHALPPPFRQPPLFAPPCSPHSPQQDSLPIILWVAHCFVVLVWLVVFFFFVFRQCRKSTMTSTKWRKQSLLSFLGSTLVNPRSTHTRTPTHTLTPPHTHTLSISPPPSPFVWTQSMARGGLARAGWAARGRAGRGRRRACGGWRCGGRCLGRCRSHVARKPLTAPLRRLGLVCFLCCLKHPPHICLLVCALNCSLERLPLAPNCNQRRHFRRVRCHARNQKL